MWILGHFGNMKFEDFLRMPKYENISKSCSIKIIFEKLLTFWWIFLNFAWVQIDRFLPPFLVKNGILQWWNLDKSFNPTIFKKGVHSTPQHTDSHPCTTKGGRLCSYVSLWLCSLCSYVAMYLCGYVAMWLGSPSKKFTRSVTNRQQCWSIVEAVFPTWMDPWRPREHPWTNLGFRNSLLGFRIRRIQVGLWAK